jgi:hypothetical protein
MYEPKLKAREHQRTALERMLGHDAFALLMEMGTGKSKVILDEFGEREQAGDLHDLMIIAPAGAYRNWWKRDDGDPGEMQKHLSSDLDERLLVAPWISGPNKKQLAMIDYLLACRNRPRAFVVNVEALSSVKLAQKACREFLSVPERRAMLVVDESTSIKRHSTARTKQLLGYKKMSGGVWESIPGLRDLAPVRRIATGLVAPRDPMDLWSQFAFLDPRILRQPSFYGFMKRYAVLQKIRVGGRAIEIIVGFRNIEELHELIAPYSYRCLKEDCLDLEPKVYLRREVALTETQERMYRELKANATAMLDAETHVTATAVITQILRLDQLLCGHVVDELGNIHDVPETRIDTLIDVLEEHSGKAIIWTAYDRCVRKIAARLINEYGNQSVACFWGGNRESRHEDELRFKTDAGCRFMVATPGAGGKGNTWTVATLSVYHSNTHDLEHRAQSEDRNHRDGLVGSATYVDLVAAGTIDEKKLKALRAKINMASAINGDNYREWLI